ncbi:MAG: hypothetical protein KatS3mg082_2941 [Nitrospiraceae bacterium]|nr:MAG: hypothetical protein KatS3mg081_2466 [Gemmatimonadales bacterium]GIW56537.1 MAG: hypothetical protein KatS3mg082_2941 [Nitrospiraceae bacterium]
MKRDFLGDSYDIVKHCLLSWLRPLGRWAVHPMFTEPVSPADADAYSKLLGAPLISVDQLHPDTDRSVYFAPARQCQDHLLLDPDTGISEKERRGSRAPAYLFMSDLKSIAASRRSAITMVFDQSLARGKEASELARKLKLLHDRDLSAIAYQSHASFVLVSRDRGVVKEAFDLLVRRGLPEKRLLWDQRE